MYPTSFSAPVQRRGVVIFLLLVVLASALALGGCDALPDADSENGNPTANVAADGNETDAGGERRAIELARQASGGDDGSSPQAPPIDRTVRYQWTGQIVLSEVHGIQLGTDCGSWMLTFESPEIEAKAANSAGLDVIVWGYVTGLDDPGVVQSVPEQSIKVESVFLSGDPMPDLYVPEYPCGVESFQPTYSWSGTVEVGELEGRHIVLSRGCDTWVLQPKSDETAAKLEESVGEEITVWGRESYEPSIYMQPTIIVESAYKAGDPRDGLYVPEYPCPGTIPPDYPIPGLIEIDLLPGEIAAVGKLVKADDGRVYLETESGRVLLKVDQAEPIEILPEPESDGSGGGVDGSVGTAQPGGTVSGGPAPSTVDSGPLPVEPAPAQVNDGETIVVGTWSVENGQLVIDVRYILDRSYVHPRPITPPEPAPMPIDGEEAGYITGQVAIGPLCPVEPCTEPAPNVYSKHVLVLESENGERIEVPLSDGGYFRAKVEPGTYVVTLSNCDYMGCSATLPVKVEISAGTVSELVIDIDTGIR